MEAVLEDNGLKDFIDQEVPKPTDATELEEWKKCVARARRILLVGPDAGGDNKKHQRWILIKAR